MNTGKVKFYNDNKGFGFIIDDETKKEVFVHRSGVREDIQEDDRVTYRIEQGQKGLTAVDVEREN